MEANTTPAAETQAVLDAAVTDRAPTYSEVLETASRTARRARKLALLLAVPPEERAAAALIVDAIATEIVPPGELWAALRPVLARLAREAAQRVTDDSTVAPLGYAYAADVRLAARELERADARRSWARTKPLRRWDRMCPGSCMGPGYRDVVLAGMRDAVRLFRGPG